MKKRISNLKERINTCLNSRNEWDEVKANEILSYFIPRAAVWSEDTKTFYYANSGTDWDLNYCIEYLNKEDRIWWNPARSRRLYVLRGSQFPHSGR